MISKPRKTVIPVAEALRLRPGSALIQRKYDGEFLTLKVFNHAGDGEARTEIPDAILLGELVKPKSGGAFTAGDSALLERYGQFFAAFDLAELNGQNLLRRPTRERWETLRNLELGTGNLEPGPIVLAETASGGEGIEAFMADGAEGVCVKPWESPYGDMIAAKRLLNFLVTVTGFCGDTQSVEVADAVTREARGKVALRGGKCEHIRIGSRLKLNGLGVTADGRIREPRPDQDAPGSWLVQY